MTKVSHEDVPLWRAILDSVLALPAWVLVWMVFCLGPVNIASLFFLNEPGGQIVAVLAFAGMFFTLLPIPFQRGVSKATAFGHCVFWSALVLGLLVARPAATGTYDSYLTVLLVVNVISLIFDYVDAVKWLRGDRAVARGLLS